MAEIKWLFAPSNGGRDAGVNDPGLQTFKDNFYRYLARELIQNSLDACADPNKPVEVEFDLVEIGKSDVPDLKNLRLAILQCKEFWEDQAKSARTFEVAADSLDGRSVRCLRVGDRNTRGVQGADDERQGDWYNLVRCAGSSAKGGGEGGSFGIGKNAPFAASDARTVFYSTKLADRSVAFQGVALLATHQDFEGVRRQPTGFLGGAMSAAIRAESAIPERFRRQNQGTDIWIMGYAGREPWENDLIFSVLESFWPAIEFGLLKVRVGDTTIDRQNLASKLRDYSTQTDFTGHIYYQAYNSPVVSDTVVISGLGECYIYLNSDEAFSTKAVALIRKTGMVVTQRSFRAPMPFAGVFLCRNDIGNARLREMEPPRHDEWSPDLPEPRAGRKIFTLIGDYIRQSIRKLSPAVDMQELSIPGLERFLPDAASDNSTALWNADSPSKSESAEHFAIISDIKPIQVRSIRPTAPQVESDAAIIDQDGEEIASVGLGSEQRDIGDGGERAAREGGAERPGDHSKGQRARPSIPMRYRSFIADEGAGRYNLSLVPEASSEHAFLSAYAVGDDQRSFVPIIRARFSDGDPIEIQNGSIGPLNLATEKPARIEMFLEPGVRYALEVVANEAE